MVGRRGAGFPAFYWPGRRAGGLGGAAGGHWGAGSGRGGGGQVHLVGLGGRGV